MTGKVAVAEQPREARGAPRAPTPRAAEGQDDMRWRWLQLDPLSARVLLVAAVLYAGGLALYLPLASRAGRASEAERQRLIAASPVVYVAPYGLKYHRREHYGRLSSPLSLYEATERQYEYCGVCHPPPPAALLPRPWYVAHPVLAVVSFSWLYVTVLLAVLLVIRRRARTPARAGRPE